MTNLHRVFIIAGLMAVVSFVLALFGDKRPAIYGGEQGSNILFVTTNGFRTNTNIKVSDVRQAGYEPKEVVINGYTFLALVPIKTVAIQYAGTGSSNVVVDMRNAGRRWQRQPLLGRMFDGVLRDTNGVPIVDDPQLLAAAEQLSRLLTNYCILVSPIP